MARIAIENVNHPGSVEHVDADKYEGGAKAGWWAKAVQLDLEAKGVITRTPSRPIRFHRS